MQTYTPKANNLSHIPAPEIHCLNQRKIYLQGTLKQGRVKPQDRDEENERVMNVCALREGSGSSSSLYNPSIQSKRARMCIAEWCKNDGRRAAQKPCPLREQSEPVSTQPTESREKAEDRGFLTADHLPADSSPLPSH